MIFRRSLFWFIVFVIITLVSLFVNYKVYTNRNEGYVYALSSYNSIYYPSDLPAIKRFENTRKDSVSAMLSDSGIKTNWTIKSYGAEYKSFGRHPLIYLPMNGETY